MSENDSEMTGVLVSGEWVRVPWSLTVREIRTQLPPHLVDEFNEVVETTALNHLKFLLPQWGLPLEKLLVHRREHAERLYRSVCEDACAVVIPADLDVDVVIRNEGWLSEADARAGVPYESTGSRDNCGGLTFAHRLPTEDELHGGTVVTSGDEAGELREGGYTGHIWVRHGDGEGDDA